MSAFTPRDDERHDHVTPTGEDGVPALEALQSAGISRRGLLGGLAGIAAAGYVSGALPGRVAFGATGSADAIVVLFLRGAYDGMSLLAPVGDPGYRAARPTIALPAARGLRANSMFAWHPDASGLASLYRAGHLAPILAVAAPDATRSHFDAMERMESCSYANAPLRSGWLDRYARGVQAHRVFSSVALGGVVPRSLTGGLAPELAVGEIDTFDVSYTGERKAFLAAMRSLQKANPGAVANATLTGLDAVAELKRLHNRHPRYYPTSPLGRALNDVATLIKSNLGLRVATVDAGGWDMHTALGKAAGMGGGWFGKQISDLSTAVSAFAYDLGPAWQRTTLVVMSEFGRRVAENGSGGVDHGHGNTWLVAGGSVRGGRIYGHWPGLATKRLDDGDLAGTTDHRAVLAEVLARRGGASARTVASALPGAPSRRLGFTYQR